MQARVLQNLSEIKAPPGVQLQDVPCDNGFDSDAEDGEDDANADVTDPKTATRLKHTEHGNELYDDDQDQDHDGADGSKRRKT